MLEAGSRVLSLPLSATGAIVTAGISPTRSLSVALSAAYAPSSPFCPHGAAVWTLFAQRARQYCLMQMGPANVSIVPVADFSLPYAHSGHEATVLPMHLVRATAGANAAVEIDVANDTNSAMGVPLVARRGLSMLNAANSLHSSIIPGVSGVGNTSSDDDAATSHHVGLFLASGGRHLVIVDMTTGDPLDRPADLTAVALTLFGSALTGARFGGAGWYFPTSDTIGLSAEAGLTMPPHFLRVTLLPMLCASFAAFTARVLCLPHFRLHLSIKRRFSMRWSPARAMRHRRTSSWRAARSPQSSSMQPPLTFLCSTRSAHSPAATAFAMLSQAFW